MSQLPKTIVKLKILQYSFISYQMNVPVQGLNYYLQSYYKC